MTRKNLALALLLLAGLAACTKESPPLQLYFVGSTRFTAGNRSGLQPADTLAARLYALADSASGQGLTELKATVTYSPNREPFAYPYPLTAFVYSQLPTGQQFTFYDTLLVQPYRRNFLLTTTFGIRTTTGSEHWEFDAYDAASRTSTRGFTLVTRRADSAAVYNDYLLRLNVPARGADKRRFLELKSGLALPGFTVLGHAATLPGNQQAQVDLIQTPDGLRLLSPDTAGAVLPFSEQRWPSAANRRKTRLRLTALAVTDFTSQTDTTAIRRLYTSATRPVRASILNPVAGQVYAFRTKPLGANEAGIFGLLRIVSVPGGSAAGLQLQVRTAKQPL